MCLKSLICVFNEGQPSFFEFCSFSFLKKYLFIYLWLLLHRLFSSGERGLLFTCSGQASHCGGFSSCGAWALASAVGVPGLQSTGSTVAVYRVSGSAAFGIFLKQGSNSCLLHWQVDSLPPSHQEAPFLCSVLIFCFEAYDETIQSILHTQ